jgi:ferredoxin-NADP reductase
VSQLVLRVSSVRRATESARIVRLELGAAPYPYRAGQAATIGPAGHAEHVAYSIASAPEETARHAWLEFLIKIDAADRWGTNFEPIARGQRLAVSAPRGSFVFPEHPDEPQFLFIAGGTGIAPLRSMIRHALISERPETVSVLYSARTPRDFAYLSEFRGMARKGQIDLALTATRETLPRWRGGRGRIAAAQLALLVHTPATLCFVCGPKAMVDDVLPMLHHLGIEQSRIRLEEW